MGHMRRNLQKWYAHSKNNCTDWVQKCQHHPSLLYQNIQFCSVLMAAKIQNDCYKIGIQFKVEYADAKENSKKFVIISPPWNCTILFFFHFATQSFMKWYFTQLTVTLLNCRKVWSNLSYISSVFCTIFCKRVHCDGSTSGFVTSAIITVNKFAKNSAIND